MIDKASTDLHSVDTLPRSSWEEPQGPEPSIEPHALHLPSKNAEDMRQHGNRPYLLALFCK